MFGQRIKKAIIDGIKKLSMSRQKKLHDYARALLLSRPVGTRGTDLLRFSGSFDKKSIKEMMEAL